MLDDGDIEFFSGRAAAARDSDLSLCLNEEISERKTILFRKILPFK